MPDPITGGLVAIALSPLATNLVKRTLGPMADEVGEHWRGKVKGYFDRNRTRTLNRAAEMVELTGKEAKEIPVRTMLLLGDGAAAEDNPDIQEMWAALIANAAVSDDVTEDVPPNFAVILTQLSPLPAQALRALRHSRPLQDFRGRQSIFGGRAHGAESDNWIAAKLGITDREKVEAAIDTLMSLGLATRTPAFTTGQSWKELGNIDRHEAEVRITALGQRFLRAVEPPTPKG